MVKKGFPTKLLIVLKDLSKLESIDYSYSFDIVMMSGLALRKSYLSTTNSGALIENGKPLKDIIDKLDQDINNIRVEEIKQMSLVFNYDNRTVRFEQCMLNPNTYEKDQSITRQNQNQTPSNPYYPYANGVSHLQPQSNVELEFEKKLKDIISVSPQSSSEITVNVISLIREYIKIFTMNGVPVCNMNPILHKYGFKDLIIYDKFNTQSGFLPPFGDDFGGDIPKY